MKKTNHNNRDENSRDRREGKKPLIHRLQNLKPSVEALCIEEPQLLFGDGQLGVDPKAGIAEYGPFDVVRGGSKTINLALIGTPEGVQSYIEFLQKAQAGIEPGINSRGKFADPFTFPRFPGFSSDSSFRADFVSSIKAHHRTIHSEFFDKAVTGAPDESKIRNVVELLIPELEALSEIEPQPQVVVILLPPIVQHELAHVGASFSNRRERISPAEKFRRILEKEQAKTGQAALTLEFDDGEDAGEDQKTYFNIHHALKARAMAFGLATQIVWESTLRDPYLSSVAWNMFTGIYYKSGNIPWQLDSLPENTCFVGVGFYRDKPFKNSSLETSLAQVFGAGEGIVLRGDKAVVDRERGDRKPHLSEESARKLIEAAIGQYEQQHGALPARVVLHKTSKFWEEELRGFKAGLGLIKHYDFLAIEQLGMRMMRVGKNPVLRGTMIPLAQRRYLLYTSGYIPYLRGYPGKRIPDPLDIVEHYGDSTGLDVCREILALTKLNWNSSAFSINKPITLRFAGDVGKILRETSAGDSFHLQRKYRFYM
ncbi:hypothetical protein N9A94_01945 [Akkermansiaceae bacterium]|nr:hypothetical protein [Akkermansiaceae bacterium]